MKAALAFTRPPSTLLIEPQIRAALEEDLGRAGDITSDLTIPADKQAAAKLVARKPGRIAGLICAEAAFRLVDASMAFEVALPDGSDAAAASVLATVSGPARSLLTAERVALNFLGPLSGTATLTAALVKAVEGTKARIVCTRKTLPGLRTLQKYAVRCGGAQNHRLGLYDMVLIKENHIIAAGSIGGAISRAHQTSPGIPVEVEVESLGEFDQALAAGADIIMLDELSVDDMREAVKRNRSRESKAKLEASGSVTLATVREIALTGVDYVSIGGITKHVQAVDLSMRFEFAA